jgi:protein Mpv17
VCCCGSPTVIFGPAATLWFRFLSTSVKFPSKRVTIMARVGADQLLFAPTNLFCFLSTMAFLEGWPEKSTMTTTTTTTTTLAAAVEEEKKKGAGERIADKLDSTYWMALSRNYMVWPFIQIANFSLVPLHHRVLVVNVIALGWNCYLSYLNSGGGGAAAAAAVPASKEKKDVKEEEL